MRKRLGQNFLINPEARAKMIDALGITPGDTVWEVGPGLGAMTDALLERGALVTAFEIDPGFIRVLREVFGSRTGFTLVEGDALQTWRDAPAGSGASRFLGNLPYTIGARLLGLFIEERRFFTRMVVTVQREVADRMRAPAGSKDYSSLSALCASAYRITPLMLLRGASFYPVPRVESQALLLDLKPDAAGYPPAFYALTRRLFASRRKTLRNNLRRCFEGAAGEKIAGTEKKEKTGNIEKILGKCGIDGNRRPETLCLEELAALARELE
jgi:16S rRNA (adenine1518-N6/adenine1519-N6)-dimethyltransferase